MMAKLGQDEANKSELAREFGVSRKTLYKWRARYRLLGQAGLTERSRRPYHSPRQVDGAVEALVCDTRLEHQAWGGRKIRHKLLNDGRTGVPAASTITGILDRNGLLAPERRLVRDWVRFEEEEPNDLWQMDFKGHFATTAGRCHPLTVLDDHSRFNLCLVACPDETGLTVQECLTRVFQTYGMPRRMLMDNGAPWGHDGQHHTRFSAWLMRMGIYVSHGRPYHPQTQGKEERFHRTLKAEVLRRNEPWHDLAEVEAAFRSWRRVYNEERPHEALGHQPPASRYRPSPRPFPTRLEPIEYQPGDHVRKVQGQGRISFRGQDYRVGKAFIGQPVALRASPEADQEGGWDVYYCRQRIGMLQARPAPSHL
jgi:transposase InsO family protein